jgi:hydrophobic/amphiphilic exporter-1 (mainly G- bacteria), HAE1 family
MLISNVAIRRPVLTAMAVLAVIIFGLVSYTEIGVDLMPKVEFPVITITTTLPGADPETTENRVTDVIEEAVNTLSGIKTLRSTSADSVSLVSIEFELEKKVDVAFQEVQARVNTVKMQLPTDVDEPVIEKLDFDAMPVVTVLVSGDKPQRELSHAADKVVKEGLQRIAGVGSARLIGNRDRKIWLWLDPVALKRNNLTVRDVQLALQREHIEMPGGRVETGPIELAAKTKAEFQSAEEFNQLILTVRDSGVIRLADVGFAEDGLEELRTYAQKGDAPTIALEVRKQSGTNTVAVADAIKAEVERLKVQLAPQGIQLALAQDMSIYIKQSVHEVLRHLIEGGGAAVLIVLLFLLNFRSTFISAMVLPTSVIATFMMMGVMGFTINIITLMALSLAIGLLIDDAIVVQENIMRHVQSGKPARQAAEFATSEIGLAVLAATLSVVSVFVPTAYTKGIIGRFFFPFGMCIAFAVLLSMCVSFTLDPMLSSRLLRRRTHQNFLFQFLENSFKAVEMRYEKALGFFLRHRVAIVITAFVIFVGSLYLLKFVRMEFQPTEDQSEFSVTVRAPLGASLERTHGIMEQVRARIDRELKQELEYTFYSIGATSLQRVNEGQMYVKLKDKELRTRGQKELMEVSREALKEVKDGQVSVQLVNRMGGGGAAQQVQLEIRGPDFSVLNRVSDQVQRHMKEKDYYVDVDSTFETGKPELDVLVRRERAAQLGVSPVDVANTVRAAIGGVDVGKFKSGSDRYDIAVRFLESYRNQREPIESLWVPSSRGSPVELRNVAEVTQTAIPVQIQRTNRQRQITVLANLEKGKVVGEVLDEVERWAKEANLPPAYTTAWAGMINIMQESFRYLLITMMLSVVVIYIVLAAQFESLIHPFTIMLTLPLAFIGSFGALVVLHMTMSMFTMIAFIFLLGLVTKNAILLIDYTNTLRNRDGLPRDLALQKAGPVRLRPILMTTMAMIAGMFPVAIGTSAMRRPMAVAIIGGLVSSTVLTLLIIPVVYSLLDPLSEWMSRRILKHDKKTLAPHGGELVPEIDGGPAPGHESRAVSEK